MTTPEIQLCDYAVAFIDLLGQKSEMPGRHLPEDREEAIALVKKSVGRIVSTQKHFQNFFDSYSTDTSIYSQLPPNIQRSLPDMAPGTLKWQRFSDGFVIYIPLGKGVIKSPVNSIFGLLMASGLHCMVGLAAHAPVRVGIDVAWGVEYRPNEFYGAAVAHSYQLESEVAQWPRVVIGDGLTQYLQHYTHTPDNDLSSQYRRLMAKTCLGLITNDIDNNKILHYLGQSFQKASHNTFDDRLIREAKLYITSQLLHWKEKDNKILETHYEKLAEYFSSNGVFI